MKANERRFTPRHKLKIPLTIQPLADSNHPAQSTESSDVSIRGIYFATDLRLEIGAPVQVLLQMPEEITGKVSPKWSCRGRVVRVDSNHDLNGKRGIGVEIHYRNSNRFHEIDCLTRCNIRSRPRSDQTLVIRHCSWA